MIHKPLTNFALSSALWLTLLPAFSHAQDKMPLVQQAPNEQAQIFLNAGALTSVEPLMINFHPQQVTLEEDNMELLIRWITRVKKMSVPIHVYSYASPPPARRNMTEKSAQNMAMRKAFNRAIEARNVIETQGIESKKISLHTIGASGDDPLDQLKITIR
ncbi:MAG: hypothetical protein P8P98_07115, partial [Emcibacteraceae bacterium]|nr:hypothetical protein [Emcibacteraceae bacterium]